jgi:hypothetical protein
VTHAQPGADRPHAHPSAPAARRGPLPRRTRPARATGWIVCAACARRFAEGRCGSGGLVTQPAKNLWHGTMQESRQADGTAPWRASSGCSWLRLPQSLPCFARHLARALSVRNRVKPASSRQLYQINAWSRRLAWWSRQASSSSVPWRRRRRALQLVRHPLPGGAAKHDAARPAGGSPTNRNAASGCPATRDLDPVGPALRRSSQRAALPLPQSALLGMYACAPRCRCPVPLLASPVPPRRVASASILNHYHAAPPEHCLPHLQALTRQRLE